MTAATLATTLALVAVAIAAGLLGLRLRAARRDQGGLRRELEQERAHAAALERSRIELAANLAHEIGTPLTALRGYVETLRDDDHGPDDRPRFLEICLRNVERLERLVAEVAELAEVESEPRPPALAPVPAAEAIDLAVATLTPLASARGITVRAAPTTLVLAADRDRLVQVLVNLLDNAVKFTASGGTVAVRGCARDGRHGIEVVDDGPGIDRASLPRVTERFFRVDRSRARGERGGFGLGLAIAKHLVERMGGELVIASELGVGTTATVWLKPPAT